jgi:phosphocarrier protein
MTTRNDELAIQTREVTILNRFGLHARPAMQLVELANRFACKIELSNGALTVDAKSIMSVMRLAATQGTVLNIVADGDDAEEALGKLEALFAEGFGEMNE